MAKKREPSVLGLAPLPPLSFRFTELEGLVSYSGTQEISPREADIWDHLHEDKVLIAATHDRSRYGLEAMNELKYEAASDTWATVQEIELIRQEARGTECQAAMDEFCKYLSTISIRHALGVIEVTANQTMNVMTESLLSPPEPPKKGFLARLFGG